MRKVITLLSASLFFFSVVSAQTTPPFKFGPAPNARQMKYLKNPMAAFIHFGMNTFAGTDGIEWGNDVKRPASTFNPTKGKVDTDQWVRLLRKAGFTRVIITLKHHDGFCTWPTKVTDYNISKSPYLNGQGDLAKELSESCDKYGMDMGVYLSPWDAWEPSYGDSTPGDYNDFYDAQLRELLGGEYGRLNTETGKREIAEIWLDGATGSGVAHQTYDFARYVSTVRELQPNCLTWMTLGAAQNYSGPESGFPVDAFWVGNESGYVNDPVWLKVIPTSNGASQYQANGTYFCIPEADVSIRPGWFYHSSQDGSVKSLDYLIHNIYFRSVGMGIPLLLNIPPNREGKFHPNDSVALMKLNTALTETFKTNLIQPAASVAASAVRGEGFEASKLLDNNFDTYWTMPDGQKTGTVTVDLGKDVDLDVIRLQEYIPLGQRISSWKVEVEVYGNWKEFGSGQTIGYQRMIKGTVLPVRKIRLSITSSLAVPVISSIEAYRSDASIASKGAFPSGIKSTAADALRALVTRKVSKLKFEVLEMPSGRWPTLAEMRFYKLSDGARVEIDRTGFTATATSEARQAVNGEPDCPASNTLDNNLSTIWQPEWKPKVSMPQSLTYDFGKQIELTEISYQQRQTSEQDIATKYNIYIAENAGDPLTKSLEGGTFTATLKTAQFTPVSSTDWTVLQNYSNLGIAIQSKTNTATARFGVEGGWFRLLGAKSPDTGILEIWIDGTKTAKVDTYSPQLLKDGVIYENNSLSADNHVVEVKATGTKNDNSTDSKIILQNLLKLENGIKAMFEIDKAFGESREDAGIYTFEVRRFGNISESASVTFITTPGTGVHGKTYSDKTETVQFAPGESSKTVHVTILENSLAEGNKDFYIELNNPTNNHILGFIAQSRVLVYDNDGDSSNSNLEGYCIPGGTQHSQKKAYLESASTTGAKKNFAYSATSLPSTVYIKYLEDVIEAERGTAFTLKLKAFSAGERSASVVYQDFRYNKAYIYADWNADLTFTTDEKIAEFGQQPPSNNILGNFDTVMDITQPVTVPQSAILQSIPLRVLYHNAWYTLPNGACTNVTEGMVYDFKLNVVMTSDVKHQKENLYKIHYSPASERIVCSGDFIENTRFELISSSGLLLKSLTFSPVLNEVAIPVNNLPKGCYLVVIRNSSTSEIQKVLI